MRGKFITFEGIDGSGKTTQLHLAAEKLRSQGYDVIETREPGGTIVGEELRNIVLNTEEPLTVLTQTLLYLAARNEHIEKVIRPSIAAGKIVLCDRFSDSTLVYQGYATQKDLVDIEKLKILIELATNGFSPDITLLFDGKPETFIERRNLRGVTDCYEKKGIDFQHSLREGFLTLAKNNPQRICIIDAEKDLTKVSDYVNEIIIKFLKEDK